MAAASSNSALPLNVLQVAWWRLRQPTQCLVRQQQQQVVHAILITCNPFYWPCDAPLKYLQAIVTQDNLTRCIIPGTPAAPSRQI